MMNAVERSRALELCGELAAMRDGNYKPSGYASLKEASEGIHAELNEIREKFGTDPAIEASLASINKPAVGGRANTALTTSDSPTVYVSEAARLSQPQKPQPQPKHYRNLRDRDNGDVIGAVLDSRESVEAWTVSHAHDPEQAEALADCDFGSAIRGLVFGKWSGVSHPARMALDSAGSSNAGYTIPAVLSARVIDLARNSSSIMRAGAKFVPMTSNELRVPRLDSDAAVEWMAENETQTLDESLAMGAVVLRPKTVSSLVAASIELASDSPNIGQIIQRSMAQAIALAIDSAALRGTGSKQPLGLLNISGIETTAAGGAIDADDVSGYIQTLWTNNCTPNAIIESPVFAGWRDRNKDTATQWLNLSPKTEELTEIISNQCPSTELYIGDFSKFMVGMRTELMVDVSRSGDTAMQKRQIWFRAMARVDVGVERANHFNVITGITNS